MLVKDKKINDGVMLSNDIAQRWQDSKFWTNKLVNEMIELTV